MQPGCATNARHRHRRGECGNPSHRWRPGPASAPAGRQRGRGRPGAGTVHATAGGLALASLAADRTWPTSGRSRSPGRYRHRSPRRPRPPQPPQIPRARPAGPPRHEAEQRPAACPAAGQRAKATAATGPGSAPGCRRPLAAAANSGCPGHPAALQPGARPPQPSGGRGRQSAAALLPASGWLQQAPDHGAGRSAPTTAAGRWKGPRPRHRCPRVLRLRRAVLRRSSRVLVLGRPADGRSLKGRPHPLTAMCDHCEGTANPAQWSTQKPGRYTHLFHLSTSANSACCMQ